MCIRLKPFITTLTSSWGGPRGSASRVLWLGVGLIVPHSVAHIVSNTTRGRAVRPTARRTSPLLLPETIFIVLADTIAASAEERKLLYKGYNIY